MTPVSYSFKHETEDTSDTSSALKSPGCICQSGNTLFSLSNRPLFSFPEPEDFHVFRTCCWHNIPHCLGSSLGKAEPYPQCHCSQPCTRFSHTVIPHILFSTGRCATRRYSEKLCHACTFGSLQLSKMPLYF